MVRTRADGGRKAVAAKAPRKAVMSASASSSGGAASPASNKYAGGNPVCPRPVPEWQKGIKSFFVKSPPKSQTDKENSAPLENDAAPAAAASASCTDGMDPASSGSSSSTSSSQPLAKNGMISDDDD